MMLRAIKLASNEAFVGNVRGCIDKRKLFHGSSCLANQGNIEEKSKAFKKFKLKQARMQSHPEIPTYLIGGLKDKILYNITVGLVVVGVCWSMKILHSMS